MNRKFLVVHIKLSKVDENEAKRLAKKIFPYLIEMSGDLERFLGSHGLLHEKQNRERCPRFLEGDQETTESTKLLEHQRKDQNGCKKKHSGRN